LILSIIIPVYNEEKTIKSVLDEVAKLQLPEGFVKEIIVVNDGSTDSTEGIIANYDGIKLINKENGGKGSAVKVGYNVCRGDYVIVKDADLEQRSDDILKLLNYAIFHKTDFLIGSRFTGSYRPSSFKMRLHKFVNTSFGWVIGFLVGAKINDAWSGYKLLSKKSLYVLKEKINEPSIEFELESILIIGKSKIQIHEIPINYNPRWYADGKKTSYRHVLKSFRYLSRAVMRGHE